MEKTLSFREVCTIIKEGSKAGVAVIRFRNLYLRFDRPVKSHSLENTTVIPSVFEAVASNGNQKIDNIGLVQEELKLKEQRLAELRITEPYEFEQMLARGDLTDESGPKENETFS